MLSLPARPKDAAAPLVRAAGATETQRGRVDIDDDLDPRWRRLFLLGMSVMTEGPKALVGSALRTVLGKVAATPLSRVLRGRRHAPRAIVERDDHDDRTGQRGPADLSFRSWVLSSANVGATGTGWLVTLVRAADDLRRALVNLLGRGLLRVTPGAPPRIALVRRIAPFSCVDRAHFIRRRQFAHPARPMLGLGGAPAPLCVWS